MLLRLLPFLVGGSFLVAGAIPGAAQEQGVLEGWVLDEETGQPLEGVAVSVLDTDRSTLTGQDGRFSLGAMPAGVVQVRLQGAGYATTVDEVEVVAGATTFAQLRVLQVAAMLDEVLVRSRGEFRDREDLGAEARSEDFDSHLTAADLLGQKLPGVRVSRATGIMGRGLVVSVRGISSITGSNEPAVYLDGVRLAGGGSGLRILDEIPASQVRRIRVLRGRSAAAAHGETADGAILIETRRGGRDDPF